MTGKSREDYAPDIGGFLDGIDGDIVDVKFAIATGEYADKIMMGGGDAKPPVVMIITVESPELEKPAVQSFSVGSSELWEVSDDEKSIKNVKNPDKHGFRKGSRAYSLIESMFLSVGGASPEDIEEVLTDTKSGKKLLAEMEKGQDFFIKRDAYMTEAKFAEGLSFSWATMKLPTAVEGKTSNAPFAVKFLGDKKVAVKGKAAPAKVEKKADTTSSATDVLDAILAENASGLTDTGIKGFAVRNPEIKKDTAYLKAVVSGEVLKRLENSGKIVKDPETGKFI